MPFIPRDVVNPHAGFHVESINQIKSNHTPRLRQFVTLVALYLKDLQFRPVIFDIRLFRPTGFSTCFLDQNRFDE